MPIVTVDELVEEAMAGNCGELFFDQAIRTTRSNPLSAAGAATVAAHSTNIEPVPASLPGGSTHVLLDALEVHEQTGLAWMPYEAFLMGSVDLSTTTFTDGVAAPTRLAGGTSQQIPLALWMEMATDIVSNRVVTVEYTDQDGNTGATAAAHTITVNANQHSGGFVVLAAGDTAAIDVTNITATGGTTPTGTVNIWGVLPITINPTLGAATAVNLLSEGVVRRIAAGAELRALRLGAQTATRAIGQITYVVDTP